jgi:hypothetical protein
MNDTKQPIKAIRAVVFLMKDETRYTYVEYEPHPDLATTHLIVKERLKKGRWSVIGRVVGFELELNKDTGGNDAKKE